MALLVFYHDSYIFTSPVTSIHSGSCENRHCEKVNVIVAVVTERMEALKSSVVSGFKPGLPAWQARALSICYEHRGI